MLPGGYPVSIDGKRVEKFLVEFERTERTAGCYLQDGSNNLVAWPAWMDDAVTRYTFHGVLFGPLVFLKRVEAVG